jgi:hypothetical protein
MSWNSLSEWARALPTVASIAVLALCTPSSAGAAPPPCAGDSPVAVTRWVSRHRPQLVAPDSSRFITAFFLESIRRDQAQSKANDEICGICGGDIWTNSQEGYARPPTSFRESMRSGARAEVVYSTRFSIEASGPSEPRSARIVLLREQGCWKIDDIVHGDDSIKRIVSGSQ